MRVKMDLLEDQEHVWMEWREDDDGNEHLFRQRRPYKMPTRINFDPWDDVDFVHRFQLSKGSVIEVLEVIKKNLFFPGHEERSRYIKQETQLLIALRFYASGSFLVTVSDFAGVSTSSASRIVKRVSLAIAEMKTQFIKMPATRDEMLKECQAFYAKAKFPRTIGAIDCTHIKIQAPGG